MVRRCSTCVLPETVPGIRFDDDGICSYCRNEDDSITNYDFEGKSREFEELLEEQRRRRIEHNFEYDVLVAVSGGRDSSYVVLKLVRDYGLKVLCANYENPFTSAQARENVRNLVERFGLGLVTIPDRFNVHFKTFRTNLKAWMKKPDLASANLLCIACQSIYLGIFDVAHRNRIRLIIAGANPYEITGFKTESQGVEDLDRSRIRKLIVNYSRKLMNNVGYIRPVNVIPAVKAMLSLYGQTKFLSWRYPNVEKTALFYYFPYDEDMVMRELNEIGWKTSPDNPSPWRFDCEVDSVKNYIYSKMIGATEKDDMFSRYIRAGLMTRDEALERLEKEGAVNIEIVERVLRAAGTTLSELDRALEAAEKRT